MSTTNSKLLNLLKNITNNNNYESTGTTTTTIRIKLQNNENIQLTTTTTTTIDKISKSDDSYYLDLLDFLKYLYKESNKDIAKLSHFNIYNETNQNNFTENINNKSDEIIDKITTHESYLPVALIQLCIIILVLLIVIFMCKCNKMMESCREMFNKSHKTQQEHLEAKYHDKKTLNDYLCFYCYNYRMRRRFRKRRKRNKNLRHRIVRGKTGTASAGGFVRQRGGLTRNRQMNRSNSLIFRRRTAVKRNRLINNSEIRRDNMTFTDT
jgi:hypothetical protein